MKITFHNTYGLTVSHMRCPIVQYISLVIKKLIYRDHISVTCNVLYTLKYNCFTWYMCTYLHFINKIKLWQINDLQILFDIMRGINISFTGKCKWDFTSARFKKTSYFHYFLDLTVHHAFRYKTYSLFIELKAKEIHFKNKLNSASKCYHTSSL